MGSLAGHVVPGVFFLIYGIAWVILAMCTQLKMRTNLGPSGNKKRRDGSTSHTPASTSFFKLKRDQGLIRKSWLPLPCLPRLPLEPIIKIVLSAAGIIVEWFFTVTRDRNGAHISTAVYHAFREDGTLNGMGKLHHITMYAGFLLSGVVDLLTIFIKFPHQSSPFFLSIAFWMEGILFYFHTHGRTSIDVHVHFLLTVVIFACGCFSLLRVFVATNLVVNLGLGCSMILQGTWFFQVGFILYPPGGKSLAYPSKDAVATAEEQEHEYGMYVSACFAWHIMSLASAMLVLWVVLLCLMRSGVARRVSKRSGLSRSRNWVNVEENERLIVAEEKRYKQVTAAAAMVGDEDVAIEMRQMFEIESTGTLLNETDKVDSNAENRV